MNVSARRATDRSGIAFVAYLAFVVYGSLVPLDYHPFPLGVAWRDFLATPYLRLGIASRADWVANILLYIPLAYFAAAVLAGRAPSAPGRRMLGAAATFAFCSFVAVAVEFTQLFFPPRTVSLNDIVAEFLGSGIGIYGWLVWGGSLGRLWSELAHGGRRAIHALISLYVLAYLAFSLFPYDFLVSRHEFADKLAGPSVALWIMPGECAALSLCAARKAVEVCAVMPLGFLLAMSLGRAHRQLYGVAAVAGLGLGMLVEGAQIFLASGVAEGASLLTRAAGLVGGVALYCNFRWSWLSRLRMHALGILVVLAPVYLLALAWVSGWFAAKWTGLDAARANLADVHWLPFYYHYYTTETEALKSLLACAAEYVPVGMGYWLWVERLPAPRRGRASAIPAALAFVVAAIIECGKLFVPGKHPDPTNALIALAAAIGAYAVTARVYGWALQARGQAIGPVSGQGYQRPEASVGIPAPPRADHVGTGAPGGVAVALSLVLLSGALIAVTTYPLNSAYLAVALLAWGFVLWRMPSLALPAIVAALPILDFSPWSGWVLVNEFDVFMAVTLAVSLLRSPAAPAGAGLDRPARFAVALFAISLAISTLVGLAPLPRLDANALYGYLTGFNALRELKGPLWALLVLPLLVREHERRQARLAAGIVAGLCAVVAVVLWERLEFTGLFNVTSGYRAEGPFPEVHVGGGDIHAYLVTAMPFVVAWMSIRSTTLRVACGTLLFAAASYALAVTFARGGYVGYAGMLVVLAVGMMLAGRKRANASHWSAMIAVPVVLGIVVTLWFASTGFMERRVSASENEAVTRIEHWQRALDMIDPGPEAALFGMGLGSFPRTVLYKDPAAASATVSYRRSGGDTYVRLGSGRPLYLGQRVAMEPEHRYALALDLRSRNADAAIEVSVCAKSIQQSFDCRRFDFRVEGPGSAWEHRTAEFDSGDLSQGPGPLRRPIT